MVISKKVLLLMIISLFAFSGTREIHACKEQMICPVL
jgi:hypothetical protein